VPGSAVYDELLIRVDAPDRYRPREPVGCINSMQPDSAQFAGRIELSQGMLPRRSHAAGAESLYEIPLSTQGCKRVGLGQS
jgi:hypothetical protein